MCVFFVSNLVGSKFLTLGLGLDDLLVNFLGLFSGLHIALGDLGSGRGF